MNQTKLPFTPVAAASTQAKHPKEANRVSTHTGYAVRKASLTAQQLSMIETELTVAAKVAGAGRFAAPSPPFTVYMESPTRYYLPRIWAETKFGPAEASILQEGGALPPTLRFAGTPFDYQVEIVNKCFEAGTNGLLSVPCGRGKTFMAIAIAHRLGRRFLVVVDKEFLLQQWRGELLALLPGVRIGILQGAKAQVGADYDVTLCMLQTLCQRDFPTNIFPTYGLTIFDECHHLGAAHFSRSLLKVQTKHMIGLSATPKRDDGLTKVFEWFLGPPFYWEKQRSADSDVQVEKLFFHADDPTYTKEPVDYRGEVVTARLLTQIVEYAPRNERIIDRIHALTRDAGGMRKILVLSERIKHLQVFEAGLLARGIPKESIAYYVGGMKEEPREAGAARARVLLASYQMASEAMNIKTLNTVVLASPRKKIEQSTGRILRTRKEDRVVMPLIVDVVDSHPGYQRRWMKRRQHYKACAYTIVDAASASMSSADDEESKEGDKEEEERDTDGPMIKLGGCRIMDE